MKRNLGSRPSGQAGFTLVEVLIVVAIIGILASVALPSLQRAMLKAKIGRFAKDSQTLHEAFMRFNIDNSLYPSTNTPAERALNKRTLDPLVSEGYLKPNPPILDSLVGGQITAYDSPNIEGPDTQFWAVLTLAAYPSVRILVADTDQYPDLEGTQIEGSFFIVGDDLYTLDTNVLELLGNQNGTSEDAAGNHA